MATVTSVTCGEGDWLVPFCGQPGDFCIGVGRHYSCVRYCMYDNISRAALQPRVAVPVEVITAFFREQSACNGLHPAVFDAPFVPSSAFPTVVGVPCRGQHGAQSRTDGAQ